VLDSSSNEGLERVSITIFTRSKSCDFGPFCPCQTGAKRAAPASEATKSDTEKKEQTSAAAFSLPEQPVSLDYMMARYLPIEYAIAAHAAALKLPERYIAIEYAIARNGR
jgi:hypothetical protein